MTFTLGRGNEIVKAAAQSFKPFVLGKNIKEVCPDIKPSVQFKSIQIFSNFGSFWKSLTCEEQLRWIGPEKGAVQMAVGGIINSLWDMWARLEQKPVWKLLVDMNADEILSLLDFRYFLYSTFRIVLFIQSQEPDCITV